MTVASQARLVRREVAKRAYKLQDGARPVSVSEIVNRNLGWGAASLDYWQQKVLAEGGDPEAKAQAAADFGTLTHDCVHDEIDGIDWQDRLLFLPRDQQMGVRANVVAFSRWRQLRKPRVLAWEQPIVSERMRMAGTPDGVVVLDNDTLCIVDLKTGRALAKHALQLAGYGMLWMDHTGASMRPPQGIVLQLHGGECRELMVPIDQMTHAYASFSACCVLEQARKVVRFAD